MFTKVECLLHELRRSLSCWCMNDDWRKWFLSLPKVVICKLFYWLDVSHGLKTAAAATGYLFTSPPVVDVEWVWQSDGGDGEFGIEQQVQGVEARWRLSKQMKEWIKASTRLGTSMVYTNLKSVVSRKVLGQARGEPFLNRRRAQERWGFGHTSNERQGLPLEKDPSALRAPTRQMLEMVSRRSCQWSL